MKRCPECRRDYYDDSLLYCLDDGSALLEGPASLGGDEPSTAILPNTPRSGNTHLYDSPTETLRQPAALATSGSAARGGRWMLLLGLTVVAVAALAGGAYYLFVAGKGGPPVAPLQAMKFTKVPATGEVRESYLSPDGRFILRVVSDKAGTGLRLRQVSGTTERDLVAPADVYFLNGATFTPDGNDVYYVAGEPGRQFRRLYRISLLGGDPQKLIDDIDSSVTFSPDGKRFAFVRVLPQTKEATLVIANADGTGEQVLARRAQFPGFRQPVWSPDGTTIAFAVSQRDDEGEFITVEAVVIADGSARAFSQTRWRWLNSYQWLPGSDGLIATGKPRTGPGDEKGQIWYIGYPDGDARKVTNDANDYWGITLTRDGKSALVLQRSVSSNIWMTPVGNFVARQITNSNGEMAELCWTNDSRLIYAGTTSGANIDLWTINSDGSGNRQLTATADLVEFAPVISPDGRTVVYMANQGGLRTMWRMNIDGGGARELTRQVDRFAAPHFSPDGQWIFYNSRDANANPTFWKVAIDGGEPVRVRDLPCQLSPDGRQHLCSYREPVPNSVVKLQIFAAEGREPVRELDSPRGSNAVHWSPDGQSISFVAERDGLSNVWRQSIATGKEEKLTDWTTNAEIFDFAFSPDARLLALTRDNQTNDLVLIQNFRE